MVERASVMGGVHLEAELRHRCRSAPEFIRANIDRRRESRGLLPLWPSISQRAHATRERAAAMVKRLQSFLADARKRGTA